MWQVFEAKLNSIWEIALEVQIFKSMELVSPIVKNKTQQIFHRIS